MDDIVFLAAAGVVGYLVGSLSSTRMLARHVLPGQDLSTTEWPIDDDAVVVSHGVSPSALGARAGRRWGCLAALLDIAKAFLVTLAFAIVPPAAVAPTAAAVAGAATVLGHAYPIYYRFQGGWGQSPIVGSALALDWVALPVTTVGGWLTGFLVGDALIAYEGWPLLFIPFAIWRGDAPLIGWAIAVNLVYWPRMLPDVLQRIRYQRASHRPWRARVAEILRGYP